MKKNVPWHILAPSAVACDMFLLRASAHHWHVSAFLCNREFQGISYDTKKRPQIIGTNEMPDFCQMLCFSRKTRKHMQHQTNKRCSRLCGICTKTVAAVPLLSVNRGMNGSVFIWNYIKLKLNIADMVYILHFFNKYVNHFYRLRSI